MISHIHGVLLEKQPPILVVDVQGVGYEIQAPMSTFYQLPDRGEKVSLHTHFVVREDAQLLYGFHDHNERAMFRALIKVNGVGPKMALAILSGIEANAFARCVHDNDAAALTRVPGVGKKTAERLIVEMKDRLKEWQVEPAAESAPQTDSGVNGSDVVAEAESALIALGYKPQEASRAIAAVNDDGAQSSQDLIRLALKSMVRG